MTTERDQDKPPPRCAHGLALPPLRPELQAACDEMDQTGRINAFAVCRTWNDQAWEVNTKNDNIYCALDDHYASRDAAMVAGAAWLQKQV